ncbi:major paralogous domain-containing protein [Fibrobacter sp. UWR3]|uniref:fibrobacter succinogenes major paralogous domain-containing protein n=1 Tax=Fibrobacter sp. UWR3 TaxID=1896217 RepID=UPI0009248940|nr:fibrobacter succinogenes major paralogous domain-containing protein [Fibrobacter sp. UWR3]SHN07480.1 major paralogous domain-containing protein [Fibrobacter sp. UWR3]
MKNFIAPRSLSLPKGRLITIFMLAAFFALSACDDSSSAGDDDNNVILSGDSREESSDSRSNDKDEAISSSGKSNDPAEVTDDSSDSKDNLSSAGTSTKSSNSNTSGNDAKSSSSAGKEVSSSSEEMKTAWDYLNPDIDYGEFTDERDGQVYKTVKIGGQVWMAENLNYAYTGVPFDNDYYTSDSTSWCYDNDPANCDKYGRLYTWAAAMDSVGEWSTSGKGCGYGENCSVALAGSATLVRGVCPKGWHLPSNDEWKALFTAVEGSSTAGAMLKSATGWRRSGKDSGNGIDTFGFSALPAGIRYSLGDYNSEGYGAYFWSSTEDDSDDAYVMNLYYSGAGAGLGGYSKDRGFSVRCVKDSD